MSADTKKPWAGPLLRSGSVPTFDLSNPTDWVIPGILPRRGTALVTGVSGALKTSFVIHALHNMADVEDDDIQDRNQATQAFGPASDGELRRAFFGPSVSFVALEAEEPSEVAMRALQGLADSTRGWHLREDGLATSPLTGTGAVQFIRPNHSECPQAFNLCVATDADRDDLIRLMNEAHEGSERDCWRGGITVVDSVAQALAGRPENASETMSAACKGLKLLQPEGGLVIGIHHGDASHNKWHSRGHTALPFGIDHVVNIQRKGDVVTVRNLKARGFASGVVRRYQAVLKKWTDIEADGCPEYAAWVFDELPAEVPKATPTTTSASKATSTPPDAPAEAVKADAPPAPLKAATGPALRGLPLKVWTELALKPGEWLALADARERVVEGPTFADVATARRAQRWREVVESFGRAGLVVGDRLAHPEQPPPPDGAE